MTEIQTGLPNRDHILEFLNKSFEEWGDEDYFQWKYDCYPGFDPNEHCYYMHQNGLIAFRRVFPKELIVDGRCIRTSVLGDTAVHKDYRGDGLYSKLHARTNKYCHNTNSEIFITYNNIDNITFKTKKERGWFHSVLPLKLFIHSYSTVFEQYTDLVLSDDSLLLNILETVGDRLVLQMPNEQVVISDILGNDNPETKKQLRIAAEPRAIARLIERVSNDSIVWTLITGVHLLLSGEISVLGKTAEHHYSSPYLGVDVIDPTEFSTSDLKSIRELYRLSRAGKSSFRREIQDINHLLSYPNSDAVVVRKGSELMGFAVVGPYENDGVLEARVLDIIAPSDEIYRRLVKKIERYTADQGYDLIVMVSDQDLGPEWAAIDRQVIMWNEPNIPESVDANQVMPPVVTMYDIV